MILPAAHRLLPTIPSRHSRLLIIPVGIILIALLPIPAVQIIPAEAVLIILLQIPVVRIIPAETTTPTEMADDHS